MGGLRAGVYEQIVTRALEQDLATIANDLVATATLDPADAHEVLSQHVAATARRALREVGAAGDDRDRIARQLAVTNEVLAVLARAVGDHAPATRPSATEDPVSEPGQLLHAIADPATTTPGPTLFPPRPEVPLSANALLVNGRGQPRIGTEVPKELASADRVDLLCAFAKWSGLRVIEEQLRELQRRRGSNVAGTEDARHGGPHLRVLTTTYMGATERRALDRLVELGAQVKISYETRTTRLHAKAWLFHRDTGFSTAYVGSSNLSRAALIDGLEWNIRLSAVDQGHLLDTFSATFEEYWNSPDFEDYDPGDPKHVRRLDAALSAEGSGSPLSQAEAFELSALEVRPWGYQQEILDQLAAEREVHDRWRNLVVMATGTGKTVVAGLDYRRLRGAEPRRIETLLFVAHREEILRQSLHTFRHVLRDGAFGELLVGGERPTQWRHVFASIQSLHADVLDQLNPAHFDMVIVDEFHYARARIAAQAVADKVRVPRRCGRSGSA